MSDLPPAYDDVVEAPQPQKAPVGDKGTGVVSLTINGTVFTIDTLADDTITFDTSLADFIRSHTKWTGTKIACHEGGCGACAVAATYYDQTVGKTVTRAFHSCVRPLLACDGLTITTNDGLGNAVVGYNQIQQRLADNNGTQCGFCSSGMVMSMFALKSEIEKPTQAQIEQQLDGNICRCTGYRPIINAFTSFSAKEECKCKADHLKERRKIFPDIEELDLLANKRYPADVQSPVPLHSGVKHELQVTKQGAIWQDCATLKDLNFWLPWYTSSYPPGSVMLVVGQTSLAVYPATPVSVRLNINAIPELRVITQNDTGITIGATATIDNVIRYFRAANVQPAYRSAHLKQAADHLQRIGSTLLRNAATLVGNLMLSKAHPASEASEGFNSDGATLLWGLGATVNCYDAVSGQSFVLNHNTFYTANFSGKYVTSLFIPWAQENEKFMSYKIASRQSNAVAIVNAAMRAVVDPKTSVIVAQPTIVFGGIFPFAQRLDSAEQKMLNGKVTDQTFFNDLVTKYVKPFIKPTTGGGGVEYRASVALSYFYKFFLYLQPALKPALQSAVEPWMARAPSKGKEDYSTDGTEVPVSLPIPKIEAIAQTSGSAMYVQDYAAQQRGTLYGAMLLAPEAASFVTSIDISEAKKCPGFVAFYGGKDVPAAQNGWQNGEIFSTGQVDFAGQCLGVVVATTNEYAWKAALYIKINYKTKGGVIASVGAAVDAKSFFPPGDNDPPLFLKVGDANKAISESDHVVKGETVETGYQYHYHLEHQATFAMPANGVLEVRSSSQMPLNILTTIAGFTGVPCSKVNVSVGLCGGAFGGKLSNSLQCAAAAGLAAMRLNRPVVVAVDMQKCMQMLGCRASLRMDYDVGFMKDGTIKALRGHIYSAAGASPVDATGANFVTLNSIDNCYRIPNLDMDVKQLKMNVPAITAVRGPGWTQAVHLMESVISRIGRELPEIPMHTLREKNFLHKGDYTVGGMKLCFWDIPEIWDQLKKSGHFDERLIAVQEFNRSNRWKKRGLAMTPVRFGVSQTGGNFDSILNIYPDGTIGVTHGGSEMGQGINTKVAQVVAFKLGLKPEEMNLVTVNDSSSRCLSAASNVSGGSISCELCSLSLMHACATMNARLAPLRKPGQTWQQLIGTANQVGVELSATGWTNAPPSGSGIFNYNSTSAAITEVEVDILTGQFELKRTDIVFDCGVSLNPAIDIGQVQGGFVFGTGYYVQECVSWDPKTGRAEHNSTWNYKVPCLFDIPEEMNVTLLKDAPNPLGVLSSKCSNEPPVSLGTSVSQALESAITEARAAANVDKARWNCKKFPLTIDDVHKACAVEPSQYTL